MSDPAAVRALIDAHPAAPWTRAWSTALEARGALGLGEGRAAGLLYSVRHDDWEPRMRDPDKVRQRIGVLACLSKMADAIGANETDITHAAWTKFAAPQVPAEDLEHPEMALVGAIVTNQRPPDGPRVQLTWRGHAAAALAWAMGAWSDPEEASRQEGTLWQILPGLDLHHPRPIETIREALDTARAELERTRAPSLRHSVLVERIKSLRWLTEPWWPELALTPWQAHDALSPRTEEGFASQSFVAKMGVIAPKGDTTGLRPAADVFRMAVSLLLQGSYLADAMRQNDRKLLLSLALLVRGLAIDPVDPAVRTFTARSDVPRADLVELVWLSAAADALFWCVGVHESLPDDDPPPEAYANLLAVAAKGGLPPLIEGAGLRSRSDIEAVYGRMRRDVTTRATSRERRFAAERTRALRWVLETRWPSPSETPWDGTDAVTTLPRAPVDRGGPGCLLALGAAAVFAFAAAACACWR